MYRIRAALSLLAAAAWGRRRDMNSTASQADCGPGEGLFQPPPAVHAALRDGPIQCRQQGLGLAEFRRSLVADAVDGAHQQPQTNLLRQTGKRSGVEAK